MYVLESILYTTKSSIVISKTIADGITWLGYFNSAINPVIYAFYSRQFRAAFYRLTIGKFYKKEISNKGLVVNNYFYDKQKVKMINTKLNLINKTKQII